MNSVISKIASLSLALLVLFSTMSFTVGTHYCGNIMVDKAILSPAQTCNMHQETPSDEKSDCCDDELDLVKGQDTLHLSKAEFDFDMPLELAVFSFIHFSSPIVFAKETASTELYVPPQYSLDLLVLHQVLLI